MILGMIWTLFLGGLAGWIAGKVMHSEGSVIRNIILCLIGGIVGAAVLRIFGIQGQGILGGTLVSVVGACILIWLGKRL